MTYETLLNDALSKIPEFKTEYDIAINRDYIDTDAGLHIVFGFVFTPLLEKALESNKELAKRMFDYLEEMSQSDDSEVVSVCDQSVLEALCGEYNDNVLLQLSGDSTKEGLRYVRTYIPNSSLEQCFLFKIVSQNDSQNRKNVVK